MKIELPDALKTRLQELVLCTHKSKSYYVEEALKAYLDVYEEDLKALAIYQQHRKDDSLVTYPLEQKEVKDGQR